jgi:outer membrane receptor protein involved in Fe transport
VRATDAETTYGSTGLATGTTNISARQRGTGGYGELLWNQGAWAAALSGRVDNFQTFDVHKRVNSTATVIPSTSENVFDPRLGLVRRLRGGVSLTGSVFRAFRGPTQNELYRNSQVGSQLTTAPPSNTLKSERATGFELGGALERQRLGTIRASYFWTEVNRPITAVFISTNNYQRANLGQIRSRGVSLDFVTRLAAWLQVSGGYQFAFATVTRFDPQPALVGLWIPEVARNAGALQVRATKREIGTLELSARESGRLFDDTSNTQVLHSFFRLDLFAEHEFGRRFSVYGTAQNLLGRRIEAGRTPLLTLAQPRTALVGLRVHLN